VLLLLLTPLFRNTVQAQATPVTITIAVTPPYSPKIQDYINQPNKVMATLINTSREAITVYLQGSVAADGGIRVYTNPTYIGPTVTLQPGVPFRISQNNLQQVFNQDHLVYNGITREQIISGAGLPEGDYTICLKAFNTRNEQVSPEEPQGCSNVFTISDIEVPQIQRPVCNDEEEVKTPQLVTFSWSRPTGSPMNTSFTLKIVELLPSDQNPTEALHSTSHPVFFTKTLAQTTTILGPSDPQLIPGKSYAFNVTASDPENKLNFRNHGESESCRFTYGKPGAIPADSVSRIKILIPECDKAYPNIILWKKSIIIQGIRNKPYELGVNNTHDFYVRWEALKGFGHGLIIRNAPEQGVVYQLHFYDQTGTEIWNRQVWSDPFYQQGMAGLPFKDKENYALFIEAFAGEKFNNAITIHQKNGSNQKIGESYYCGFEYVRLPDGDESLVSYTITGKLIYKFQDHPEEFPLYSSQVKLVKHLEVIDTITGKVLADGIAPFFYQKAGPETDWSVKVDESGHFLATIKAHGNGGNLGSGMVIVHDANHFGDYSGKVVEYLTLEVNSPYYVNPSTVIPLSKTSIDLGKIVTPVYSFTLKAEVKKGYFKMSYAGGSAHWAKTTNVEDLNPKKVKAILYRNGKTSSEIPYYEGDMLAHDPNAFEKKVSYGTLTTEIGTDGKARTVIVFDRLICSCLPNDNYYLDITQDTLINGKAVSYFSDYHWTAVSFKPSADELAASKKTNTTNFSKRIKATIMSLDPPTSSVSGKLVFRDPDDPQGGIKPLAMGKVSLMLVYTIQDSKGHSTVFDAYHVLQDIENQTQGIGSSDDNSAISGRYEAGLQNQMEDKLKHPFSDGNTILATANTDAEGNFVFDNFANLDTMGTKNASGTLYSGGSGEYKGNIYYDGKLTRTVRLVITDWRGEHMFNPSDNINIQPLSSMNVGVLTAYLKTYKMTVVPRSFIYNKNDKSLGDIVYGAKVRLVQYDGTVLGEKFADSKQGCTFSCILRHNANVNWDDCSIQISTNDTVGENAYKTRYANFPRNYTDYKLDTTYSNNLDRYQNGNNASASYDKYHNYEDQKMKEISKVYYKHETDFYFIKEDYKPVSVNINVYLWPKDPVISGRVLDASNPMRSVDNGSVYLFGNSIVNLPVANRTVSESNQHGYFTFPDLISGNKYNLQVAAKGYSLFLSKRLNKPGDTTIYHSFGDNFIPSSNTFLTLKTGQQISFPQILMKPDGTIRGYVINEKGNPVSAFVRTTRSILHKTTFIRKFKPDGSTQNYESFEFDIPTYATDTLFIIPDDLTYFTEAIPLSAMTGQQHIMDLEKITVKERLHRISIKVLDDYSKEPVQDISVSILDYHQVTDKTGNAAFHFKNASRKNFWIKLTPAETSAYIPYSGELTNAESKEAVSYTYYLHRGYTIKGKVTTEGQPVPYAQVWVKNMGTIKRTLATDQGAFELKGVQGIQYINGFACTVNCSSPPDSIKLPPSGIDFSNLVGQEKSVNLPKSSQDPIIANFDLQQFAGANLSKLHGFPLKVTKLKDLGSGSLEIDGQLDLGKVNSSFKTLENGRYLDITKLKVVPDPKNKDEKGRPYLEANPGMSFFQVEKPTLKVILKGRKVQGSNPETNELSDYFVLLEGGQGSLLKIQKKGTLEGSLVSRARIVDNSFNFPGSYFNFQDNQFYLAQQYHQNYSGDIPSFSTSAMPLFATGSPNYFLTDGTGSNLRFKFLEFNARSQVSESFITPEGIVYLQPRAWTLNPLLKAYGIIDTIGFTLPRLGITANGLLTQGKKVDKVEINFEKWHIVARNCDVGPEIGGIRTTTADIQTGNVNIPIGEFTLRNDLIYLGKPNKKNLSLGGIWSMNLTNPDAAQFGLDPKTGRDLKPHYKLCFIGDPAATISDLPGFGGPMQLQAVSLISNGEQIISFAPNCQNIRLYNVVNFKPVAFYSYADAFSIDGLLDFDIPRLSNGLTYKLKFTKQGSGLGMNIVPTDLSFDGPGYVKFESLSSRGDQQEIKQNTVTLRGTIREPSQLDPIRIKLTKKLIGGTNYDFTIERDKEVADQFIAFGKGANGGKFKVDEAKMTVISKDWDILRLRLIPDAGFSGQGFGSKPLSLAVFGEIKSDPNINDQTIKVTGSETPFGDFVMTFDWPNKRILGTMNIKDQDMGGVTFGGAAEMLIDANGFYFAALGNGDVPSFGPFSMGILVGAYNSGTTGGIPQSVQDMIFRYSITHGLPCSIASQTKFTGLFVTGRIGIPLLCYNKTIPLGVANASVYTNAGAEVTAYAQFVGGAKIGYSLMLDVIARLDMSAITCTSLGASVEVLLKGEAGINVVSGLAALDVCSSIEIKGYLEQRIPELIDCGGIIFHIGSPSEPVTLLQLAARIHSDINIYHPGAPNFSVNLESFGSNCDDNACEKIVK